MATGAGDAEASQGNAVGNTKPTTRNESATQIRGSEQAANDSSLNRRHNPFQLDLSEGQKRKSRIRFGMDGLLGLAGLFGLGRGRRSDSVNILQRA